MPILRHPQLPCQPVLDDVDAGRDAVPGAEGRALHPFGVVEVPAVLLEEDALCRALGRELADRHRIRERAGSEHGKSPLRMDEDIAEQDGLERHLVIDDWKLEIAAVAHRPDTVEQRARQRAMIDREAAERHMARALP
ncbi:MAG: hypothetical protein KL863_22345 [Rhizobium sp.]|nr:hypothetical protein [Rhizobium sp.]